MNLFIALVFSLTLYPNATTYRFKKDGELQAGKSLYWNIPNTKMSSHINVYAEASGKNGDLDCYLLVKGKEGWHIIAKDEDNSNVCSLSYVSSNEEQARLWLVNNGIGQVYFNATVDQGE